MKPLYDFSKEPCPLHSGKRAQLLCLDTLCPEKYSTLCSDCLQATHRTCQQSLVVDPQTFAQSVAFNFSPNDFKASKEEYTQNVMKDNLAFNSDILKLQLQFVSALSGSIDFKQESPDSIAYNKRKYIVSFDQKDQKIYVKQRPLIKQQDFEAGLAKFRSGLIERVDALVDHIRLQSASTIDNSTFLNVGSWTSHPNIQLTQSGPALLLKRNQGDNQRNNLLALCNDSLQKSFLFKVTINKIYSNDRFLEFGLINKEAKARLAASNYVLSQAEDIKSFYGYGTQGKFVGQNRTCISTDPLGLKAGDVIYYSMENNSVIRVYSQDNEVDLECRDIDQGKEYLFFVSFYYPDTGCLLEKLI